MNENSKIFKKVFIIVSFLIPVMVVTLLFLPKSSTGDIESWIFTLPFYNAIFNSLTAILLISGYIFVKKGNVKSHKLCMIGAFILGALFLILYVIYHSNAPATKFGGEGIIRYVYFFFLLSHILLAFIVVPLVLTAIYFAVFQKIDRHKKIVKFTFPVWLYVSITGTVVYFMISPYYSH